MAEWGLINLIKWLPTAHCPLTVRLPSLHFEANRGGEGGIIINLLGLYQRENSWDMGVREGGQQDQGHLYPQLFAVRIEVMLSMDRRYKTTSAITIPIPQWTTLLAISIRKQWNRYFHRCYWTRHCLCT